MTIFEAVRKEFLSVEPKEAIDGTIRIYSKEKAKLTVQFQNQSVTVFGKEVALAEKQPMTKENIAKQIEKTGKTPFSFSNLLVETFLHHLLKIHLHLNKSKKFL